MKAYRVNPEGLEKLCAEAFAADGMAIENAKKVAASLVCADLRGVSSHGMVRLGTYIQRSHKEQWNQNPHFTFTQTLPAVCMMDGDDGFGSLVGTVAMEKAMELADIYGIGAVAVKKSAHFGMASYYPLLAAKKGFIGFACTNGMPNLAHFGSREGMLGTNPFSVAIPVSGQEPMVLDVACSVTARGNIANYKRENKPIPAGWAMDKDGNPTTDAEAALKGSVLPFGGHKGSGLAIVVDMLCGLLAGAAYGIHLRDAQLGEHSGGPNVGHFFVAMKVSAFCDPADFEQRAAAALQELRDAEKAPGFNAIYMPGDLEAKKYQFNKENGILMGAGAFKEFCETCAALGLKTDPHEYIMSEEEVQGK